METDKLLQMEVRVVNIGLREFARDLERCNVPVVHLDWSPPAVATFAALPASTGSLLRACAHERRVCRRLG